MSDREARAEAEPPAIEIEITPEMIEAGLSPLLRFNRERVDDEATVIQIFRAMILASRK